MKSWVTTILYFWLKIVGWIIVGGAMERSGDRGWVRNNFNDLKNSQERLSACSERENENRQQAYIEISESQVQKLNWGG